MDTSSALLIRGIFGAAAGILAILWPGITIAVVIAIFAVYAVGDGVATLMATDPHGRSWAQVVQGSAGVAAGVLAFIWPGATAVALVWFIASWAIVTGATEVVVALRLRTIITGEWLLLASGVLSMLLGLLLFVYPVAGAVSIAWMLGVYTLAAGAVLIALGVRLRTHATA